jgi:hypothetical protein
MEMMIPWYKAFKGTFIKYKKDSNTLQITEIPFLTPTETYRHILESMTGENENSIIEKVNN